MRWVIDEIHVLRPIRFAHIRRNEISAKIPVKGASGVATAMKTGKGSLSIAVEDVRQQRAAMVLRDVRYGIAAHVEVVEDERGGGGGSIKSEAKHLEMFKRRASRGQYFHHPYLGTREFPADFTLVEKFSDCPDDLAGKIIDLGFMLHEIEFVPDDNGSIVESHRGTRLSAHPRFFHAHIRDGVVRVPSLLAGEGLTQ